MMLATAIRQNPAARYAFELSSRMDNMINVIEATPRINLTPIDNFLFNIFVSSVHLMTRSSHEKRTDPRTPTVQKPGITEWDRSCPLALMSLFLHLIHGFISHPEVFIIPDVIAGLDYDISGTDAEPEGEPLLH